MSSYLALLFTLSRTQSHTLTHTYTPSLTRTGMELSVKELSWLAELPFYIRSVDLGCVFVHAGFKAGTCKNLSSKKGVVLIQNEKLRQKEWYHSDLLSLLLLLFNAIIHSFHAFILIINIFVGKKLNEQDPWVMMTVRSLLPDGRMSPRCFNRYGPRTILESWNLIIFRNVTDEEIWRCMTLIDSLNF